MKNDFLMAKKTASSRFVFFAVLAWLAAASANAATQKYWELSPYRVQIQLVVDDREMPRPGCGEDLMASLQTKIRSTVYPIWKTTIRRPVGAARQQTLTLLKTNETGEGVDLTSQSSGSDKLMFLSVKTTRLGVELRCREYDCTTQRWGTIHQQTIRQAALLYENCFQLLCETFAPLATVRSIADSDKEVLLNFRGNELPRQSELSFLTIAGEPFQPLMVRTTSSGEIKADSIRDISWTYLTLSGKQEDGWHGRIHSGTRRPFGIRRRGRIEHFALALRTPPTSSDVRFYARHDSTLGLTGYEVFRRKPDDTSTQPMGLTNSAGAISVTPGEQAVTILFLRSEGQLLAKVPVVPGAKALIEVPIADDTARLRAQAALTSLTEQLIDTVAKRNLLIARVRDRLNNGKLEEAQELFTELDSLPGRSQFDRDIRTAGERELHRSSDPKVQQRIDKLFADTRKLLSRFLSTKPIAEVQGELTAARRAKPG